MSRLLLCCLVLGTLALAVGSSAADDYIYWSMKHFETPYSAWPLVMRAKTDGSSIETVASIADANARISAIAVDVPNGNLYYGVNNVADASLSRIVRANLDGSSPVALININDRCERIQLDTVHGKIYWTNCYGDGTPVTPTLKRANLDGTNVETIISSPWWPDGLFAFTIDAVGGKLYYTTCNWPGPYYIYWCNLDGTANALFSTDQIWTILTDLAVDPVAGKLYCNDPSTSRIRRMNLDGTGVAETVYASSAPLAAGMCVDAANQDVYFSLAEAYSGNICRINTDGTGFATIVTGVQYTMGVDYSSTLALALNVGPVNPFTVSDFKDPMGSKKKLGSTLPVKFQLFQGDAEMETPEQIGQALGLDTAVWPRILLYDATNLANELGIDLPEDGNVGEGGDLGDCFRYSDGNWIFNLRLNAPIYAPRSFLVKVKIGDIILEPGNSLFQTK